MTDGVVLHICPAITTVVGTEVIIVHDRSLRGTLNEYLPADLGLSLYVVESFFSVLAYRFPPG
ncbi:MAG TPA: hypothetical protein VMU77_07965 [Acidimicrobiales bacterium]|nr:hypothetical protein [Acidimicrobiales bacterium]